MAWSLFPRFEIGLAQVFAGGQGIRVPRPPALLGFGQNALGEADRLLGAPGLSVRTGEVGAGRDRARVGRAEQPLSFVQRSLVHIHRGVRVPGRLLGRAQPVPRLQSMRVARSQFGLADGEQ